MEVSTDAPSVSDSQEDEDSYEPDPIRRDGGSEPFTPRWKAEVTPEVGHGGGGAHWYDLANLATGSFSVIHFSLDTASPQIVAVETHEAPAGKN